MLLLQVLHGGAQDVLSCGSLAAASLPGVHAVDLLQSLVSL